jgi:hypothetical protein
MCTPTLIKIENSKGDLLTATKESSIPTEMGFDNSGKLQMRSLIHAVGVTWMFTKVRITFVANGKEYTAEKAGATIEFTKAGIKMTAMKPAPAK